MTKGIEIEHIAIDKKKYLELLLLGDESEKMIDLYLERGDVYILKIDDKAIGECVITDEGEGIIEIKNIAIMPSFQRMGYGRMLIQYIKEIYRKGDYNIIVGTGETPSTLGFYESCGFIYSHRIKNFFTDNYDHPIVEDGVMLRDMIYLKLTKKGI